MTATWRDIARKDFEDAVRSRVLWSLIAIFVAFLVMALLTAEELVREVTVVDEIVALRGTAMLAQLFIPGVALVAGYMAVSGERQSGSLRVLLSYPFSRGDVILGKYVGRTVITMTALLIGFAVATVLIVALYGTPAVMTLGAFVAAGMLLGSVFTALAIGGSAVAQTRSRAMGLTIGPFVAMVFFWKPVIVGMHYAIEGSLPGIETEAWYLVLKRLNPLEAYRVLVGWIIDDPIQAVPHLPLEDLPPATIPQELGVARRIGGEVPLYLDEWFALVILLAWGVIPLLVGYRHFVDSDIA